MKKLIGRPPEHLTAVRLDHAVQVFIDVALRKAAKGTLATKKTVLYVMREVLGDDYQVWRISDDEMSLVYEKAVNGETVEEAAAKGRFGRAVRSGRNTEVGINQVRTTLNQFIRFCTSNRRWMKVGVVVPGEVFIPSRLNLTEDEDDAAEWEDAPRFAYADWGYILQLAEGVHPRARIAVALGLHLGRRASEIIRMKWKRINWEAQLVHIFNVKRRRWVWMPLHEDVRKELQWWYDWTLEHFGEVDPEWYVVPAKLQPRDVKGAGSQVRLRDFPHLWPIDPTKMSRVSSLVREARRVLALLGFESNEKTGTHTWRRSAALHVALTYGILAAQALLDHQDVRTTQRYTGNNEGTSVLFTAMLPGVTPPSGFGLEKVEHKVTTIERLDNVIPINRRRSVA